MQMGKYSRKAVALAGVLAVTLIAAPAVEMWAGAFGPASTDAALVDPAVAMDHDAGVCIGDPVENSCPATSIDVGSGPSMMGCPQPPAGCRFVSFVPCCYRCPGGLIYCL